MTRPGGSRDRKQNGLASTRRLWLGAAGRATATRDFWVKRLDRLEAGGGRGMAEAIRDIQ